MRKESGIHGNFCAQKTATETESVTLAKTLTKTTSQQPDGNHMATSAAKVCAVTRAPPSRVLGPSPKTERPTKGDIRNYGPKDGGAQHCRESILGVLECSSDPRDANEGCSQSPREAAYGLGTFVAAAAVH